MYISTAGVGLIPAGRELSAEKVREGDVVLSVNGTTVSSVAQLRSLVHPGESQVALLIQRGDRHEIRNTGASPLKTLNVYVPPAYTDEGEELPAGRSD